MRIVLLVAAASLGASGCGGGGDDGGCEQVWYVDVIYDGATGAIVDGRLELAAPAAQGRHAIEVARPIPDGDFDVRFEIAGFSGGGPGAFVGVALQGDSGYADDFVRAALITDPMVGVEASFQPVGASDLQPTDLTTATLRVERRGLDVTVTASTADATATAAGTFDYRDLVLAIHLGSTGPVVTATSAGSVQAMVVHEGDFAGDEFDCDSFLTNFDP